MSNPKKNISTNVPAILIDHEYELCETTDLSTDLTHPRQVTSQQTEKCARLIDAAGILLPIVVDDHSNVMIGSELLEGAKLLGLNKVPVIRIKNLSEAKIKALRTGYYKILEEGDWDQENLKAEFDYIIECEEAFKIDFGVEITGFEVGEIDVIIGGKESTSNPDPLDSFEDIDENQKAVSKEGDLWLLGKHRLYCGSALDVKSYETLMGDERAHVVFTDPPYNVPINGHVCGKGKIKHREFTQASGEMNDNEFKSYLESFLNFTSARLHNAGLIYCCIDWRSSYTLESAARANELSLINICVWNKNNGGMGSFYRSKHEFVHVYRHGNNSHLNNIQLGQHGRYRTNIWDYAGVNTMRKGRMEELSMHPTVKPVGMISDAIRDCTKRNDIVLDPFMGSGSTIIAAEKIGRRAFGIEIDALYIDTAIRRWQDMTGEDAIHSETKIKFNATSIKKENKDA